MATDNIKVKILKQTVANRKFVKKDATITVNEKDAKLLVYLGKAEYVTKKDEKAANEE